MVDDNKNDAANPHKVFQWPDESTSKGEDPLTIWILATVDRKQIQKKLFAYFKQTLLFGTQNAQKKKDQQDVLLFTHFITAINQFHIAFAI